jgi:hypothetical protein
VAVYDFKARSWSTAPSLPTARALLGLAAYQGALWAVGGVGADKAAGTTVEVFHP